MSARKHEASAWQPPGVSVTPRMTLTLLCPGARCALLLRCGGGNTVETRPWVTHPKNEPNKASMLAAFTRASYLLFPPLSCFLHLVSCRRHILLPLHHLQHHPWVRWHPLGPPRSARGVDKAASTAPPRRRLFLPSRTRPTLLPPPAPPTCPPAGAREELSSATSSSILMRPASRPTPCSLSLGSLSSDPTVCRERPS